MPALVLPNTIANATPADGAKVQENFVAVRDHVNTEKISRDGSVSFTQPVGGVAPTAAAHLVTKDYADKAAADVGDIKMSAAPEAPTGWLFCRGQAVSRTTYSALYTAIGTAFGAGDGSTTFNVPDLRSRSPLGFNPDTTAFPNVLGAMGGQAAPTMPSHSHGMDHDHGSATSSSAGAHTHTVASRENMAAGGADGAAMESNTSGTNSTITTSSSGAHTHTVDLPNYAGSTAQAVSGDAVVGNYHPVTVINFLICTGL